MSIPYRQEQYLILYFTQYHWQFYYAKHQKIWLASLVLPGHISIGWMLSLKIPDNLGEGCWSFSTVSDMTKRLVSKI